MAKAAADREYTQCDDHHGQYHAQNRHGSIQSQAQRQQTSGQTGQLSAQGGIDVIEYRQHTAEQHDNDYQHDQHQHRRIQQCRPNPAIHLLPAVIISGQSLECFLRPSGTLSNFYQSAHISRKTRGFPHRPRQGASLIGIVSHILQHRPQRGSGLLLCQKR